MNKTRRIEATAVWMEKEMFAYATSFHQAAHVLERNMFAKNRCHLAIPLVVNSAFSIELYLKCLVFIESGKSYESHDLAMIFAQLSSKVRTELSAAYGTNLAKKSDREEWFRKSAAALAGQSPEKQEELYNMVRTLPENETLEEALHSCRDTFVTWRYTYEGISPSIMSYGVARFKDLVRTYILSLRPFLGCPKQCYHPPPLSGDMFWKTRRIQVPPKRYPTRPRLSPEWQTRDMLVLASSFHTSESMLSRYSAERRLRGLLHAAVLNNAFSTELYLKCLLFIETGVTHSGHDLEELFRQLPRRSKDQLESVYRKEVLSKRDKIFRRTIVESVRISGRTFEEGRYFFEGHFDKIHYTLFGFNRCLRSRILSAKPELDESKFDKG